MWGPRATTRRPDALERHELGDPQANSLASIGYKGCSQHLCSNLMAGPQTSVFCLALGMRTGRREVLADPIVLEARSRSLW